MTDINFKDLDRSVVVAVLREKHKVSSKYALSVSEKMLNDIDLPDKTNKELLLFTIDSFNESCEKLEQFFVSYENNDFSFEELIVKIVDLTTEFSIRSSEMINKIVTNAINDGDFDLGANS